MTLKESITKPDSIANQANYLLTALTLGISGAVSQAIQSGHVIGELMFVLWILWMTAFGAKLLEKWVKWITREKNGASRTSSTGPTTSSTSPPS